MSDIILKFWPLDEVSDFKTDLIKRKLKDFEIIDTETIFWDQPAFTTGKHFNSFFLPDLGKDNPYIKSLAIVVSESDYGVISGEEDFEFIDRYNVISIFGGDGTFENWDKMTKLLSEITGDIYEGGWELL